MTSPVNVVTRFAPSPTGLLHIGGARTALFNWLYARGRNGKFLLRIEDTDQARQQEDAEAHIIEGLRWLGLDWDGPAISQRERYERHQQAAQSLIKSGAAYKCFSDPAEIENIRAAAKEKTGNFHFRSPWRDTDSADHPDRPFCVRLKLPEIGKTMVNDVVHGHISWNNTQFDDLVILRSDGSPTYNFAVVVDDHDMEVTHVIRGDDHLNNTPRQQFVYDAFGWTFPTFAHVPLLHDEQGKKLTKRGRATGLHEYVEAGIPPEAMRNYLARLGWSHGDDEFFTTRQALSWFDLGGLRKSSARLDYDKLLSLSRAHLAACDDDIIVNMLEEFRTRIDRPALDRGLRARAVTAIGLLKSRARSFMDLDSQLGFLELVRPISLDEDAEQILDAGGQTLLRKLMARLEKTNWSADELDATIRDACRDESVGYARFARPLRAALTGRTQAPGVIEMMLVLGRSETIARIHDVIPFRESSIS